MALNPLQKRRIFDEYLEDKPLGAAFDQWCADKAELYNISARRVGGVVAEYAELEELARRQATINHHQKVAALAGATAVAAMKTLERNLRAGAKKVIQDRTGNIVDTVFVADPGTQVRAATELLKIHGAYAPTEIIQHNPDDPTKLSNEELAAEIRKLTGEVAGLAKGGQSQESGAGCPVLVDELHANEG